MFKKNHISEVPQHKLLSVTIDDSLTFKSHIGTIMHQIIKNTSSVSLIPSERCYYQAWTQNSLQR